MSMPFSLNPNRILLLLVSIFIFGLTYFAQIDVTTSDPALSLLVSQAIIEHHTVRLDAYEDAIDPRYNFDFNYRVEKINGHYYYFFPIAPSVFSIPVVWVANLAGMDMVIQENESALQNIMSALSCVLIFVIIYGISRYYLDSMPSLVITTVSILGSSLISTMGTALWNMNFAVLFVTLILLLITRYDSGKTERINPNVLGFLLFIAFWCRPTSAPFILVIFGYILLRHRAIFLKVVATSAILLILLMAWFWSIYGQLLPDYYLPTRLTSTPAFWEALYGNAFSPARGLFIFNSFFTLIIIGAVWLFHDLKKYDLFWLSIIWFGLYYIAISRKNEDWWGGHQYGSRLLIDGMPALILMTIFLWREISQHASSITKTIVVGSYIALGGVGIFINSYQGLYNPYTNRWNKSPNIDSNPQYLFDWRYPQFLATEETLRRRNLEYRETGLTAYALGTPLTFEDNNAVFWDWYEPDSGWRWTQGASPQIVFKLGEGTINSKGQYVIEFLTTSLKGLKVGITLNKVGIGVLTLGPFTDTMPAVQTLVFSGSLLEENNLNRVKFDIPPPAISGGQDPRTAGVAFVSLKVYPASDDTEGVHYFDSEFFQAGFSHAEVGWRWTDGITATITYPYGSVEVGQDYIMEITTGASGVQTLEVFLNDTNIGNMIFDDFNPETYTLTFSSALLKQNDDNKVYFLIPNATIPDGDSRRLGLAFVSLKIHPVSQQ